MPIDKMTSLLCGWAWDTVRVDESLYLANTPYLEDRIYDLVAARRSSSTCRAVNFIDASALERPGGDG